MMFLARVYDAAQGRPVPPDSRCSQVTVRYDERGRVSRREYFKSPDEKVAYELGCHRVGVRHDFRGRVIERTCLDDEGRLIASDRQWARVMVDYEGDGGVEESYFDLQNQLVALDTGGGAEAVLALLAGAAPPASAPVRASAPAPPPSPPSRVAVVRPPSTDRSEAAPPPVATPEPAEPVAASDLALGDAVAALVLQAEKIRDDYDDFLDDTDRDPEGEEEQIEELLDDLEDAADELESAYRHWSQGGGRFRKALGTQRS
ncbi:MAG TPA: hypothetical protein VMQ81_04285, partial [Acidimicrobiia bacterium]|nr:hypothetical protein [Acidimicrobiia bacterium]